VCCTLRIFEEAAKMSSVGKINLPAVLDLRYNGRKEKGICTWASTQQKIGAEI
jgi:hypothetical protein